MKSFLIFLFILLGAGGLSAETLSGNETSTAVDAETYDTLDNLFILYQPYLPNIAPYKPIYFLMGANPKDSRFQLSFKYQLFGSDSPLASKSPWVTGIHMGYTQTSSWDLKSDSAPFEDTSYMPEVFFLTRNVSLRPRWIDALFFQAGILHESNGRDGEDSRSTNYFYFNPKAMLYNESERIGFGIAPKLVCFFNNSENSNPDIEDYRGFFELELKAGTGSGIICSSTFHFASEGTSMQFDLTYPLTMFVFKNLEIYVHAQYVDVLAETLLNYRERTEAFRLGFSIVR